MIRRVLPGVLACAALLLPIASSAQLPFRVAIQFGLGVPQEYRRCMRGGDASVGLELQTRDPIPMSSAIAPSGFRFFGTARAEIFGGFGAHADCQILPRRDSLTDGSTLVIGHDELELKQGGTQFSVGGGVRKRVSVMDAELRVNAGVARGQKQFETDWMPVAGAAAGIVLFDHVVFTFEQRHYRVPRWEKLYAAQEAPEFGPLTRPAGSTTHHKWQRYRGFAIGYRF